MVHQVLALKYANKNKTINLKKTALLKKLVNFKEITWIRIRIKISWILSTGSKNLECSQFYKSKLEHFNYDLNVLKIK